MMAGARRGREALLGAFEQPQTKRSQGIGSILSHDNQSPKNVQSLTLLEAGHRQSPGRDQVVYSALMRT